MLEQIKNLTIKISYGAKVLTWIADIIGRGIGSFPDWKTHEREQGGAGGERSGSDSKGVQ